MIEAPNSNYLHDYSTAIAKLESNPSNQGFKYQAVLALARMGSTDFAQSEYRRYDLDKVRQNEDIMSLAGRLSKDLYLQSSGKTALEHARDSALKYELAYKETKGYYSGVNAATMALLADMPWDMVKDRVNTILELLPKTEKLLPKDHYFIEATRAECFLILGEISSTKESLRDAIEFDPLNYTAHASTLKQFRIILDKRATDNSWLDAFKPPRPVHFAGHIWQHPDKLGENLPLRLSDTIQSNDIGFAYGALAAGADIMIAEALLSEGVEVNFILPTDVETFIAKSVRPFGEAWVPRFNNCIEQSHSVTQLPLDESSSFEARTMLAAHMAMGQAILRSQTLQVEPRQLLINDPRLQNSLTARHKSDWTETPFPTIDITVQHEIKDDHTHSLRSETISVLLSRSDNDAVEKYDDLNAAMNAISKSKADKHGLHLDIGAADKELMRLMNHNQKGNILVSESVASLAALKFGKRFDIVFAGIASKASERAVRCYNLKA